MIKNNTHVKSLSFDYALPSNPEVDAVQIFVQEDFVTVTYLNERGSILAADQFSMSDHPELTELVRERTFDDVWNWDLVLSIVEPVDEEERPALETLIPAYLQSLQVAS